MDRVDDAGDERLYERLRLRRDGRQDPLAEVASSCHVGVSTARHCELLGELRGHPGGDQPRRDLLCEAAREDRSGDRQAYRAADLLEEGEAAGRDADSIGRDGVLNDQGEDRERRPDAQARKHHP